MMFNPEGDNVSFNLARLKKSNYNFEVVIDPELAFKFRHGEINDVSDVLKSEHIFFDANCNMLITLKIKQFEYCHHCLANREVV